MTDHETQFRRLVRSLLRRGIKPTPTVINRYLGRNERRKVNHLNGREARWRREELIAAGWTPPHSPGAYHPGYWSKPR